MDLESPLTVSLSGEFKWAVLQTCLMPADQASLGALSLEKGVLILCVCQVLLSAVLCRGNRPCPVLRKLCGGKLASHESFSNKTLAFMPTEV